MLADDLTRLKQELKQILPEEGISTVIKAIKSHIPSDAPKFNALLQIESRLNEANLKRVKGVLSDDQLQLQYNQLRDDLLNFIDDLKPEDFSREAAKKSKTGSVLYKVPRQMELQKRSKCIVRLAFEESVIIQNIELTSDTSLQSIRVSEAMEVAVIDPEGGKNFSIQSISSPEQFLEEDDFSEWVFYVTPLNPGSHPIILKVSVLEQVAGKERKKEIVLEEMVTIITQPVEEEEVGKSFQNAGYSFAFSGIALDNAGSDNQANTSTATKTAAAAATIKKYGMVLGAFTMLLVASWAMGLFTFVNWQRVLWVDEVERFETFMLENPNSKYFLRAKQHRDLKVAIRQNSDSLLVEFLVDYPGSELEDEAKSKYREISKEDLDERVKRRKEQKDKVPKSTFSNNDGRSNGGGNIADPDNPGATTQPLPVDESQGGNQVTGEGTTPGSTIPPNGTTAGTPIANLPNAELGFPNEGKALEALSWLELNMVNIEGGKFMMGCDETLGECPKFNTPQREVKVSNFRLCRYEVTQTLWQSIMGNNPSYEEVKNCPMCPVEHVSFREVEDFIKKLNKKTNKNYRLPSEAEWEYAARGGKNASATIYAGSDTPGEIAWYQLNSRHRPQPVGKKKSNLLGLFDMSGSVFEWCEDTWSPDYKKAPSNGEPWVKKNAHHRIIRGGSWMDDPDYLRVDYRDMDVDSLRNHITGFRLASD